jgi:excisionase family DNA binding protein
VTAKRLTIEEAAKQVNVSERTIQRWFRDGLKHEVGKDRKKRVTLSDLQAYVRDFRGKSTMQRLVKRHATRERR